MTPRLCLPALLVLPAFLVTLVVSGCDAIGNIDTAAMQTTNRAVGAPVNGPGTPPPASAPLR